VPGQCRLRRHLGRLLIPDLAHHRDIGVLAQHGAQAAGEIEPDGVMDLHLVELGDH
jgi:hypothetical protein